MNDPSTCHLARVQTLRRSRPSESGQVLVLFILIFVTTVLVAAVAIAVGQVMVRRHQAQMVVDAAAFAGASRQAEGMNTIADLNETSLFFLKAIQVSKLIPYVDSDETTWKRLGAFLGTPIAGWLVSDWAGDLLKDYQDGFDVLNDLIDITNCGYATPFLPRAAASDIVNQNFAGGDSIFQNADLDGQGVADPSQLFDFSLVDLTPPGDYKIGGYWYLPYPANAICQPSNCPSFPVGTALCVYCYGNYIVMDALIISWRTFVDPIEYKLGRFYDNDEGDDVRFAYYVKVSQSPVLFGKTFFNDIPSIVVAAAAKPYGGYLGTEFVDGAGGSGSSSDSGDDVDIDYPSPELLNPLNFDNFSFDFFGFFYGQQGGKEISTTYKAKLVPLTRREKSVVSVLNGSSADPIGLSILH